MRSRIVVLGCAIAMTTSAGAAPTPEPIVPPQQKSKWTAPKSTLDADAIARLFDRGFADPRGCEYREIEIEVTDGMDDAAKTVSTHGWVIPKQPFAIAWNGLVYRTSSVGAAASLATDMRALLDAAKKQREDLARDVPGYTYQYGPMVDEGYYVSPTTIAPGKAMMLLRLGDAQLAETIWKATGIRDKGGEILAADWLWAQFARGVGAHRRGDVALAIESWRRLPANKDLTAESKRFLEDIVALLADEQRRAASPAAPVDLVALAKRPPTERIAKLVAALDQVVAERFSGPDPIAEALRKEGDAAVEPLLAAYQNDQRFSRSRFVDIKSGDSFRYRHIIPVYEVAFGIVAQIVDTSFFQSQATDRKQRGDDLRAYWKQWRGTSRVDRQYQILADNTANEEAWLTAAIQIVAPAAYQSKQMVGESLRPKQPTVSSLFAKRLDAAYSDFRQRARMLEAFAAWDAVAAKPFLAKSVREQFATWSTAEHRGMDPYLGEALAGLTTARVAAGDTTALAEYAAWLVTTKPEQAQFAAQRWLAPMVANKDNPDIVRAAQTLFSGPSPWVPLTAKRAGFYSVELLSTDMVHVPAFRAHALSQLANKSKLGTVKMKRGGIDVQTESFQTGESVDDKDPLRPKDGWSDTLRVCDEYASMLANGRTDSPKFRRYWPVAERDRVIAAIAAWLKKQ